MKRLIIKDIHFKNFLSYGDMGAYVDFLRNDMTIITAKNGNGKSSIFEAVVFVLYGKSIRKIQKSFLVNTKNEKNCVVTIHINVCGVDYKIVRGLKPSIFEIYKNIDGVFSLIDQDSTTKLYQENLELILGMDYKTFIQTVVISKTNYTPFMKLDASSRRFFVEELLSLSLFSDMLSKQKLKNKELKLSYAEKKSRYDIAYANVTQAENNIKVTKKLLDDSVNGKIEIYTKQIEEFEKQCREIAKLGKELKLLINDDIEELYNKLKNTIHSIDLKRNKINKLNNDFTNINTICTECNQPLSDVMIANKKDKIKKDIEKLNSELTSDIDWVDANKNDIEKKYTENSNNIIELNAIRLNYKTIKSNIDSTIKKKESVVVDESELDNAKLVLAGYRSTFNKINSELSSIKSDIELNSIVTDCLKDSGIKSSIIDKSIPLINKCINKNLSTFGFFVTFSLDSEFNETIKQRGITLLKYDSFSEGEKLRIDMAILLAWREVAQIRSNTSCNLMLFDEMTDASMDFDGSDILGNMLSSLSDTNVFVITHTPEKLDSYARGNMTIEKKDGYSYIK